MNIKKAIEISDAKISFVSLVDRAANMRQFLITKSDDGQANFSTLGKILKVDDTTHYITGIVYEPLVEDADGNYMTEDEIRKAAHWFAKNGDKVDIQHSFVAVDGVSVVENYIAPCDMTYPNEFGAGDTPVIKGTWIMTVEVTNAGVWEKVQKGEVTGFSMGGTGKYSEVETDISKSDENEGLIKKFVGLFGYDLIKKGEVKEKYNKSVKRDNFWNALYALEDVLRKYNWQTDEYDFITDETAITEALTEFSDIIQNLLLTPNIVKTLKQEFKKKNETEETEVTTAEIQKMIDESIKKALETATANAAKGVTVELDGEKALTVETVQKMINDTIKKSLEPDAGEPESLTLEAIQEMITAAIEPVLKARGLASNLNGEQFVEKNEEEHYLAGIL